MHIAHNVRHVSQLHRPYSDLACGVASFAMLLQHAGQRQQYRKLCDELGVTKTPHEKGFAWGSNHLGPGVYFQDIVRWLQKKGYRFAGSNLRTQQNFRCLRQLIEVTPLMVGVTWYDCGHWIVLDGIKNGVFTIRDPLRAAASPRHRGIGNDNLFKVWDGTFIALFSSQG